MHIKTDQKYDSPAARQYKSHLKKLMANDLQIDSEPAIQEQTDVDGLDSLMAGLGGTPKVTIAPSKSAPEIKASSTEHNTNNTERVATPEVVIKLKVEGISESSVKETIIASDPAVPPVMKVPTFGSMSKKGSTSKMLGAKKLTAPTAKLDSIPLPAPPELAATNLPPSADVSSASSSRIAAAYGGSNETGASRTDEAFDRPAPTSGFWGGLNQ